MRSGKACVSAAQAGLRVQSPAFPQQSERKGSPPHTPEYLQMYRHVPVLWVNLEEEVHLGHLGLLLSHLLHSVNANEEGCRISTGVKVIGQEVKTATDV